MNGPLKLARAMGLLALGALWAASTVSLTQAAEPPAAAEATPAPSAGTAATPGAGGAARPAAGRIVVVMVWDGLRPDLVSPVQTPNLFALVGAGARFAAHHALYPTITMVNAAALATGGPPGETGILGDTVYLGLSQPAGGTRAAADEFAGRPLGLEDSKLLAALGRSDVTSGRLMGLATAAQEVEREGGYVAIVGKQGPTFLFDDLADRPEPGDDWQPNQLPSRLFVSDDMAAPASATPLLEIAPALRRDQVVVGEERDAFFTKVVVDHALPVAKAAAADGRPALVVLWQHNPDLTQHLDGLGSDQALEALYSCDFNLGFVEEALERLGIGGETDLVVVSDHGFATIKESVALADLLVGLGLKKSATSTDVMVAQNGGSDLVYLSRSAFPTEGARREVLKKIVAFAEGQDWCGPIFSAPPRAQAAGEGGVLGWIDGTFNEGAFGLYDPARAPDLLISFRELPEASNAGLMGPDNPAFVVAAGGEKRVANASKPLTRSVMGLVYADAGEHFTTGMGMHGSAGSYELHNFCAALGPDFKRRFVDADPTGNLDLAPTLAFILHLARPPMLSEFRPRGRVMREALSVAPSAKTAATPPAPPQARSLSATLAGKTGRTVTTLRLVRFDGEDYLEGSDVERRLSAGSR